MPFLDTEPLEMSEAIIPPDDDASESTIPVTFVTKYAALLRLKPRQDGSPDVTDDVVEHWACAGAVDQSVRTVLSRIQPEYADVGFDGDFAAAEAIQDVILQQQSLKSAMDLQFHHDMHTYTKRALPVVPAMLDLCDALDDSVDDCMDTSDLLHRCREKVSSSFRLLSMQRRRVHLRALLQATEEVQTWSHKFDTVVSKLQQRDYCTAIIMLGARMYSDSGSPLLSTAARQKSSWSAAAPTTVVPAAAAAAGSDAASESSPPCTDETDSSTTTSSAVPAGAPAAAPPAKRAGRQRATTIAYMAPSHGQTRMAAASPTRQQPNPRDHDAPSATPSTSPHHSPSRGSSHSGATSQKEQRLAEFVDSVGGTCAGTVIGRAALTSFFELKEYGSELVVHAMSTDLGLLLDTGDFVPSRFFGLLEGLDGMRVRGDSITRFVLNTVEPMLSRAVYAALVEEVGDDAGTTWEAITGTLVPTEFHECTVRVLGAITSVLHRMMHLQWFCAAIADAAKAFPLDDLNGDAADPHRCDRAKVISNACRFLSTIGVDVTQKALATVLAFVTHIKLGRGQLSDMLHIYALVERFVDVCEAVSTDGAAQSARASLQMQRRRLLRDDYLHHIVESIVKVMFNDMLSPFPASVADFPDIFAFVHNPSDDASIFKKLLVKPQWASEGALFASLLKLKSDGAQTMTASVIVEALTSRPSPLDALPHWSAVRLDVVYNPFFSHMASEAFTPAIASNRTPLQLVESHVLFTITSFMTCKKMMEIAGCVVQQPDAAVDLLHGATSVACMCVWFILTHFVASTETVPLDVDQQAPPNIRDFARVIRGYAYDLDAGAGYPLFPGAECNQWKGRAGMPQYCYAAVERITAIQSLDTIVACHRLVVCSLTPLLGDSDTLLEVASISEALSAVGKYALSAGFRRVAVNVLPSEPVATAVERHTFQSSAPTEGSMSPPFKSAADSLSQLHRRLVDMHRNAPFVAAQRLLDHTLLNVCLGVVDGISRQKKISDGGRGALLHDVGSFCKLMQTLYPTVPLRLWQHVSRYAQAFCGPIAEAAEVLQHHWGAYSMRQLSGIGDKENFMKRREWDAQLSRLTGNHEDRVPLFLID